MGNRRHTAVAQGWAAVDREGSAPRLIGRLLRLTPDVSLHELLRYTRLRRLDHRVSKCNSAPSVPWSNMPTSAPHQTDQSVVHLTGVGVVMPGATRPNRVSRARFH